MNPPAKKNRMPKTIPVPANMNISREQSYWNTVLKQHGMPVAGLLTIPKAKIYNRDNKKKHKIKVKFD